MSIASTSAIGLFVIGINIAMPAPVAAQVCAKPAGTYEVFGDVVIDKTSKLAWKRCSDGQSWNGTTCSGHALGHILRDAQGATAPSSEGFVWRIPRPDELATLVVTDSTCVPAIDQEVFPRTVPGNYWTSQALPKAPDHGYCQSFAIGASGFDRQDCWGWTPLPVRLVSPLPAGGYSPPAPIASSFTADDSGNFLIVQGSHFSPTPSQNLINFPSASGFTAVVPASGSGTSLKAAIPDDATTGVITVTTNGVTSQPAPGTLRVINNKDGCSAAGFTPAAIPQSASSWDYCILPSGFKDDSADTLVIGAHPSRLPSTQTNYILSTSPLSKATAAGFTLKGRVVLQFNSSGSFGTIVVLSNAGKDADTLTSTGAVSNNGLIDNRGNFNNLGWFLNTGNGVILNSGVFANNPSAGNALTIAATGRAINRVSFSNASSLTAPRAMLRNQGKLVTESGSNGIENSHADVSNSGTLLLLGANAFTNRGGSAPGTVTNTGTIQLRIATQPEGVPILSNEPGALIFNNAGASIINAQADWTFRNIGTIQNCGTANGLPPAPNDYRLCPAPKPRGGGIKR